MIKFRTVSGSYYEYDPIKRTLMQLYKANSPCEVPVRYVDVYLATVIEEDSRALFSIGGPYGKLGTSQLVTSTVTEVEIVDESTTHS